VLTRLRCASTQEHALSLCEFERAADAYGVALSLGPATDIAVACLGNRAAALLRFNRFSEALNDCVAARTLQPEHVKAMFRSGHRLSSN
jgi:hypothetical protein